MPKVLKESNSYGNIQTNNGQQYYIKRVSLLEGTSYGGIPFGERGNTKLTNVVNVSSVEQQRIVFRIYEGACAPNESPRLPAGLSENKIFISLSICAFS